MSVVTVTFRAPPHAHKAVRVVKQRAFDALTEWRRAYPIFPFPYLMCLGACIAEAAACSMAHVENAVGRP